MTYVINESTLQFTNCDIEAIVDEMMECEKDVYSEETFIKCSSWFTTEDGCTDLDLLWSEGFRDWLLS